MSDLPTDEDALAEVEGAVDSAGAPGGEAKIPGLLGVPDEVVIQGPNGPQTVPYHVYRQDRTRAGVAETGGLSRVYRESVSFPRYREGDQYAIYSMTPAEIAALQDRLVRAGLLDPDEIAGRRGVLGPAATDPTAKAYTSLLEFANQSGAPTVTSALDRLSGHGRAVESQRGRGSGGRGGGLPAVISNADELRAVFRAAVVNTLGRGWSDADIDRLVATYQGMERGAVAQGEQMALAAAASGGSPGTVEALPSAETFAINAAREADPLAAKGQDFLSTANRFFSLIGQWNPASAGGELPVSERPA